MNSELGSSSDRMRGTRGHEGLGSSAAAVVSPATRAPMQSDLETRWSRSELQLTRITITVIIFSRGAIRFMMDRMRALRFNHVAALTSACIVRKAVYIRVAYKNSCNRTRGVSFPILHK